MATNFFCSLKRIGWRPDELCRALWKRFQFIRRNRNLARIVGAIIARQGLVVAIGPFEGMKYGDEAFYGGLAPKLIGSYEAELHGILEDIFRNDYPNIINIGCAEGYYAVGLARRFPDSTIYAFDSEAHARELCARMAQLNDVSARMTLGGACDLEQLSALPLSRALLVCDCEGYELELLQPQKIAALRDCDLLVELHDCFDARITPTLTERFTSSHEITIIASAQRDPSSFRAIDFLALKDRKLAVDDLRAADVQWAFFAARSLREP